MYSIRKYMHLDLLVLRILFTLSCSRFITVHYSIHNVNLRKMNDSCQILDGWLIRFIKGIYEKGKKYELLEARVCAELENLLLNS